MRRSTGQSSFIKTVLLGLTGFICLLIILLFFTIMNMWFAMEQNVKSSAKQTLNIAAKNIENKLKNGDQALAFLMLKENEMQILEDRDELNRYYAGQKILDQIQSVISSQNTLDMLLVYIPSYDIMIDDAMKSFSYSHKNAIQNHIRTTEQYNHLENHEQATWQIVSLEGNHYFQKAYTSEGRTVAAFISIDSFWKEISKAEKNSITFILEDNIGNRFADQEDNYVIHQTKSLQYASFSQNVYPGAINLVGVLNYLSIVEQIRFTPVFVIVIVLFVLLISMLFLKYVKQQIFSPMQDLIAAMNKVEAGDYEHRMRVEHQNIEFSQTFQSFNNMLDVIVNLRIDTYEKKIQLQDAELQNFQLQIKPHFFLNAMTTIHSMTYQNRNEEIRAYIDALSSNVRYIFKTGLHTIPLEEELDHIKNYFLMQEFRYPDCVFSFIEADENTAEWPIPQLLIHTFIENVFKHAVAVNRFLSIFIKAVVIEYDKEKMLKILIEDDGVGFPAEVLTRIYGEELKTKKDGFNIGIKNAAKTLALMYGRNDLLMLSNGDMGGARIEMKIPIKASV